jgi:hypothetical protein
MNKVGRPSKYKEEYCDMLIDHMAAGLSYESFAGLLGVTRDCLYKWESMHENFLYSKKVGKEKMLLYFERMGLSMAAGKLKGGNAATYIFTMKNKCGWTDKLEQEIVADSPLTINYIKDE